jgi:hypothetical protein
MREMYLLFGELKFNGDSNVFRLQPRGADFKDGIEEPAAQVFQ